MLQDPYYFWKNFRLGTELQISGAFIYNALFTLEEMETFHYEEECFEYLYNLSIGIERLQKIAIILIEHEESDSQNEFEKSLITHNHQVLMDRIKKTRNINLDSPHNKFLALLSEFYSSVRYDRYNLSSVYRPTGDKKNLVNFVATELKIEITTGLPFSTPITSRIRKFLSTITAKIVNQLFEIVRTEAYRLGTNTYELSYNSKAFKIFISKEFDLTREKHLQRELSLYLLSIDRSIIQKATGNIDPLPFGQLHLNKYFASLFNPHSDSHAINEMEYLFEEHKIKYDRVKALSLLGTSYNFDFDYEQNEDDSPA